jgi:tetratricopeptide (TPR) repeat protein
MKNWLTALSRLLVIIILFDGCKSAEKSLKKGDFDDSVLRSADKLKSSPTHASSIEALKQAYPLALEQHLNDIKQAQSSENIFKWEPQLDTYIKLNRLFNAVSQCQACSKIVSPKNFENEEKIARHNAANVRYKEATGLLKIGDRESARKAYENFEKVNTILPDFNDVQKKLDLAYEIASFKVVVEQVLVTSKDTNLVMSTFRTGLMSIFRLTKD